MLKLLVRVKNFMNPLLGLDYFEDEFVSVVDEVEYLS